MSARVGALSAATALSEIVPAMIVRLRSSRLRKSPRPGVVARHLQVRTSSPSPHVDEMPGDRRRRRHGRRDEVGAALKALAALEIAVRGGGAALARRETV